MKIELDSNTVDWEDLVDLAQWVYGKHSLAKAFTAADVAPPWPVGTIEQEALLLRILGTKVAETINDNLLTQFSNVSEAVMGDLRFGLNDDEIRRIGFVLADEMAVRRR